MTFTNLKTLTPSPSILNNIELFEPIDYNKLNKSKIKTDSMVQEARSSCLFFFLSLHTRLCVGDLDVELSCSLNNAAAGSGRKVVSQLGGVAAVVHEEHFQILQESDD